MAAAEPLDTAGPSMEVQMDSDDDMPEVHWQSSNELLLAEPNMPLVYHTSAA